MKTNILQTNLSRGLGIVSRAVGNRSTLPILSHVRVEAVNGTTQKLRLAASDLELSIYCQVAAQVEKAGVAAVPARTLSDLVGTLSGPVSLSGEKSLKLTSEGITSSLKGQDASDFPDVFDRDDDAAYEASIPADTLLEMIGKTAFAAAADESRPTLTGVLFKIEDGTLTLTAADGFRLSHCTAPVAAESEPVSVVVPARAMQELARIAKGETEPIRITINEGRSRAVFHVAGGSGANEVVEEITLVTQLIEGNFPDISKIVPKTAKTTVTVDAGDLLDAAKTADIFARAEGSVVHLDIAGDKLSVSSESIEFGDSKTEIEVAVEGEAETQVALNVRFLADALKEMDGPIAIVVNDPTHPVAIRQVADPDGFVHVIMPMATRRGG